MPLTMCPHGHGAMQEVTRAGVQLDICPNCGGVWLDRGELEKIQAGVRDRQSEVQEEMRRFERDVDQFRRDPEEWRRTCMVTADGQLFVRGTYVFGMLRDAARHTKKGKGSLQPMVSATLHTPENDCGEILTDVLIFGRTDP